MSYASKAGRAVASSSNPQAFGVCDRCGIWTNHHRLAWQLDWQGAGMQNLRILVCERCMDVAQPQKRAITLPADPVPIQNPRPEYFAQAETDYRVTSSATPSVYGWTGIPVPDGDFMVTSPDGEDYRVTQTTGEPPGGLNEEPGTDPNAPGNDDPGVPLGFDEVPETGPLS